jgi:thiaminase
MRKSIFSALLALYSFCIVYVTSCVNEKDSETGLEKYQINLRWIKAYDSENWQNVRTGLIWGLCYLGATVPENSFDKAVTRLNESVFIIDFTKLGFSDEALQKLAFVLNILKKSEEYQKKNGIDVGRFLMCTLYSSWHYYAITGVKPTLADFEQSYFTDIPVRYYLTHSAVAKTQRIIRFLPPSQYQNIAFVADEGAGAIENNTFVPESFETIDLMPNGQLRFGIYDKNGKLKAAADTLFTTGGKPGKCQWCHEKHLQPLFSLPTDLPNSITKQEFLAYITQFQQMIEDYRSALQTDIKYKNNQDHSYAELLYISFMEPSVQRIANEWGIDKDLVLQKMSAFQTHPYPEYPFLGNLYRREWVDNLAPYKSVQTPSSAREFSLIEPDVTGLSGK